MMQAAATNIRLGMFLALTESVKGSTAPKNVDVRKYNQQQNDDHTEVTDSETNWSDTLSEITGTTASHEEELFGGKSAIEQFKTDEAGVEKVWFTSVTERFQRFSENQALPEEEEEFNDSPQEEVALDVVETANSEYHNTTYLNEADDDDGGSSTSSSDVDYQRQAMDAPAAAPQSPHGVYVNELNEDFKDYGSEEKPMQPQKEVHFNDHCTVYFPSPPLYPEDIENMWYEEEVLDLFRETTMIAAKALFFNANGQRDRIKAFSDAYQFCSKKVQEQERKPEASKEEAKAARKRERQLVKQHESQLTQSYKQDNLVGLEHFVLTATRGGPKRLRQFILDHSNSRIQREVRPSGEDFHADDQSVLSVHSVPNDDQSVHSVLTIQSAPLPSSARSSRNSSKGAQRKQRDTILAHVSQCMSQPTSRVAHLMAVAHHEAMKTQY